MLGAGTDNLLELTEPERRRIFNLGYYTWVEQQGVSIEAFEARREQSFWRGIRGVVSDWDALIGELNERAGRRAMTAASRLGLHRLRRRAVALRALPVPLPERRARATAPTTSCAGGSILAAVVVPARRRRSRTRSSATGSSSIRTTSPSSHGFSRRRVLRARRGARRARRGGRRARLPRDAVRAQRRAERPSSASPTTGGVWVKDETGNVSGSHKARHLFDVLLQLEVAERLSWADPLEPAGARDRELRQRRARRGRARGRGRARR